MQGNRPRYLLWIVLLAALGAGCVMPPSGGSGPWGGYPSDTTYPSSTPPPPPGYPNDPYPGTGSNYPSSPYPGDEQFPPRSTSDDPLAKDEDERGASDAHSFEAYSVPGYFLGSLNYLGRLTPASSETQRKNSSFRIVKGLAGSCKSFEALTRPGYFLRSRSRMLELARNDGTRAFGASATFCFRDGLANAQDYSFESHEEPGYFIRHRNYELYLEIPSGSAFDRDATFRPRPGNW